MQTRSIVPASYFVLCALLSVPALRQTKHSTATTAVVRDAQAVAILTQSINAAGGLSAISAIQDYTGTGTITYSWAGKENQVPVTARGMGISNFRTDAALPDGTRTWAVSGDTGVLIDPDGARHGSPGYKLITSGSMSIPQVRIASLLSDTTTSIAYMGLVSVNGQQFHQVHFAIAVDPILSPLTPLMPELGSFDLFIDSASFFVVRLTETVRSESTFNVALPHEIDFLG